MTQLMTLPEALTQWQSVLALALKGTEIIITQDEKPVAKLVPMETEAAVSADVSAALPPRIFGLQRGQIWMSDDFDAPLPDEFWLGEE
jgi:antitoxin (DNA-binding transcriptional repressor) of toxin-antitoxin stability system